MKRKMILIASILLISFFLRLAFAYAEPVKWWDETVYASLGWDLKANPTHYSFDGGWSDYVPGGWPEAGYRAPLLPYMLGFLFFFFGQNIFLLNMMMPIIGTLNVLLIYLLGKKLFTEKIGLYAAIFLALMPVHVFYSGKILTDVLSAALITLSFLLFVLWSEKKDNKLAALAGAAVGIAVLSRYISILLLPMFFALLIFKERNIAFLKSKSFLLMVLSFLLVMLPWFLYGYYEYGNPIGWFFHSGKAADYWGVSMNWYEIMSYFPAMFSITIFLAFFGGYDLIRKRSNPTPLLFLWFFAFLLFSIFLLPHWEDRFLMQITPPLAIMAAAGVDFLSKRFKAKNAEKIILYISVILLIATVAIGFYSTASKIDKVKDGCFLNATDFLENAESNALVFTDNSPVIYFYAHMETHFQADSRERMETLIRKNYQDMTVYYLWEQPDKNIANETRDKTVFACPSENSTVRVYKIE